MALEVHQRAVEEDRLAREQVEVGALVGDEGADPLLDRGREGPGDVFLDVIEIPIGIAAVAPVEVGTAPTLGIVIGLGRAAVGPRLGELRVPRGQLCRW